MVIAMLIFWILPYWPVIGSVAEIRSTLRVIEGHPGTPTLYVSEQTNHLGRQAYIIVK